MSLFKTYTPKVLYKNTLSMINTMFVHPPSLNLKPTSYFTATLLAHKWIKNDLGEVMENTKIDLNESTTLDQVYSSLVHMEKLLFGSSTSFNVTIRGCCEYTEFLENKLKSNSICVIV
jgi:hypothetical protein